MALSDTELLRIVGEERKRSIGFDQTQELRDEREKALDYYKGVMDDVPSLPNRSKAVSTDISDAVETILPDLVEIFTGGDDVATFIPRGPEDEEGAQQETDYTNFVVFQQNDAFLTFYTLFKDALLTKTGVVSYWREDYDEETETFTGIDQQTAAALASSAQVVSQEEGEEPGTVNVTVKKPGKPSKVCIKACAPEDFTVAQDTVVLSEGTYCAMRARPRAQKLKADGNDADIVDKLPQYSSNTDDETQQARDGSGEHTAGQQNDGATHDLRQVETVTHYIRLADDNGTLQLWKVITGDQETILIDKQKVNRIQIAALTPYIVTHRFYGRSMADMLFDLQRINTAITRGYLDSIYFALNQRMVVNMQAANEYTISDLLRNEPGVPIRAKSGEAVMPVQAGGAGFNGLDALEFFATKVEQRTGIARNAQGLNPDTLHDTAKGALTLMNAAQRRVRLIARIFAETGIKDLFLGVHALLREGPQQQIVSRLRGKWVPIDPTNWGEREDMSIEIGIGSGGKDAELMSLGAQMGVMEKIIEAQGGPQGPIVKAKNIYAMAKRFMEKSGNKSPELFLSDPGDAEIPPPPDPNAHKAQEAQMTLQLQAAKNQGDMQLQQAKAQSDAQIAAQKNANDLNIATAQMQNEHSLKSQTAQAELDMKWQIAQAELAMKREIAQQELASKHALAQQGIASKAATDQAGIEAQVRVGGEAG